MQSFLVSLRPTLYDTTFTAAPHTHRTAHESARRRTLPGTVTRRGEKAAGLSRRVIFFGACLYIVVLYLSWMSSWHRFERYLPRAVEVFLAALKIRALTATRDLEAFAAHQKAWHVEHLQALTGRNHPSVGTSLRSIGFERLSKSVRAAASITPLSRFSSLGPT